MLAVKEEQQEGKREGCEVGQRHAKVKLNVTNGKSKRHAGEATPPPPPWLSSSCTVLSRRQGREGPLSAEEKLLEKLLPLGREHVVRRLAVYA